MRKTRFIENCRGYHLISRLTHQAFFLDDDEKTRAEREEKGESALSRRTDPPPSKADPGLAMPRRKHGVELERGRPGIVERILKLLESGPLRSSALRKAVGIRSSIHFNHYLSPLQEKGIIARTDPDHPHSPQQRYCLT